MNDNDEDIRALWRDEGRAALPESPRDLPRASRLPGERLRRRLGWDALLKLVIALALPVAWPFLTAADSVLRALMVGLFVVCLGLGVWQWIWVRSWPVAPLDRDIRSQLSGDLERWNRLRWRLALLFGATPAMAWQLHQFVYYAVTRGTLAPSGVVQFAFAFAGGPVLWLAAAWVHNARLNLWLLQLTRAVEPFADDDSLEHLAAARRRADRRILALVVMLLMLLLAGVAVVMRP